MSNKFDIDRITRMVMERLQSLNEAPVDDFLAKKDAALPDFVATLKNVAGDKEFQSVAGGGTGDGNPKDEVVKIERTIMRGKKVVFKPKGTSTPRIFGDPKGEFNNFFK